MNILNEMNVCVCVCVYHIRRLFAYLAIANGLETEN